MKLFAQLRKVDEEKRLVYGRLAQETVDKADELMDYASSKPYFQKWSEDIAKDSDGKSVGNLRAMHGKVAAGKFTQIDFNDADKAIDVCAKVVDDNEWKKVLEGVYTGFSIGGSYVGDKKVEKVDGRDVARYTAKPSEGSLVDRPCVPTAKFFEVQKADGTLRKVDFAASAAEEDVQVNGTADEVAQLGKLMNEGGLALADLIKAMPDFIKDKVDAKKKKDGKGDDAAAADDKEGKTDAKKAAESGELQKLEGTAALRKGVYDCSSFSSVLSQLVSLKKNAAYDAYANGADSTLPAKIGAVISMVGEVFKSLIDECISDAKGSGEGSPAYATMIALSEQAGSLAKVEASEPFVKIDADPILALLKVGARHSASDKERLAKIHTLTVELGHDCAGGAEKLAKGDTPDALKKMLDAAVEPLQKALTEAQAEIKKLAAQPATPRVSLRYVTKAEDGADPTTPVAKAAEPIVDDLGHKHEAAGLIKSLHQQGGVPLAMPVALRK